MSIRLSSADLARARMLAAVAPLAAESVSILALSPGRVLAEDIVSIRDQPPFDASAMDGWAVRAGGGAALRIAGESVAGSAYEGHVEPGEAVRIFTGAPVPDGADAVVIQEEARAESGFVRLEAPPRMGANIRRRGGDYRAGETLLRAGQPLSAWALTLAASAGVAQVEVRRSPRVMLLACGDELVAAGGVALPGQIHDSVTPALAMRARQWGGLPETALVADSLEAVRAGLEAARADLVVTIGGASVGDRDLIKPALAAVGAELLVDKVAMKPGKPVFFARLPDGRLVLGLPGNPASAMVCAELFLWPVMRALQGGDPLRPLERLPLTEAMSANGPREHWMRAVIGPGGVRAFADQDSSLVSVLARSNALVRRAPGEPALGLGEAVSVLRLE